MFSIAKRRAIRTVTARIKSVLIHSDQFSSILLPRDTIAFKRLTNDRIPELIAHQVRSFFCHEPMGEALKLCDDPDALEQAIAYTTAFAKLGLSVIALNGNDKIVGASINGVLRPGTLEKQLAAFKKRPPKNSFERMMFILSSKLAPLDLFRRFDVDKIFDIDTVSVDRRYVGRNIAGQMLEINKQTAREEDFRLCMALATSQYMANSLKKAGFEQIEEVRYDSMVDEKGRALPPVMAPHETFKVIVLKL